MKKCVSDDYSITEFLDKNSAYSQVLRTFSISCLFINSSYNEYNLWCDYYKQVFGFLNISILPSKL